MIGVPICEEIWNDLGVCETLAETGAEILLVPNGSPYYRGKLDVRYQVAVRQVIESGLPLVFANQVGGQDELVFDGGSFVLGADRKLKAKLAWHAWPFMNALANGLKPEKWPSNLNCRAK